MSQDPSPPARRALGGLPPRSTRPAGGVARLIRSNRVGETGSSDEAPSTVPAAAASAPEANADAIERGVRESQSHGVPKYLQLVRREARMHSEQVSQLSDLTRALNEARRRGGRSGVGERITDNTLVRVAVDLLLQDPQRLRGTTEDELRTSVGLPPLGGMSRDRP